MTDQDQINTLADHLRAGRYEEASELARALHATCDRAGVLLQWLSVATLLEAIDQVATRASVASLLDAPLSSVPLELPRCAACGRAGEGPTCPVCDPAEDDDPDALDVDPPERPDYCRGCGGVATGLDNLGRPSCALCYAGVRPIDVARKGGA